MAATVLVLLLGFLALREMLRLIRDGYPRH